MQKKFKILEKRIKHVNKELVRELAIKVSIYTFFIFKLSIFKLDLICEKNKII